jgi:predicted flap endonuclease-1-like 5' DNA nuclease
MLEIASQIVLCLLLAALIGFIIGYLLGKSTCADDSCSSTQSTSHDMHAEEVQGLTETTTHTEPEPILLSGPRNGKKDNLTRIKGVGVKIEESLNKIGIYHFDQIAGWSKENIIWADSNLGFPGRAEREQWVEQAKALATGEETEFSKRVDAGEVSTSKQS